MIYQVTTTQYSGSIVKTKMLDFYNELIWWASYKGHGENSETLPRSIYAKLHMATTLPDSSIHPVFGNQEQHGVSQNCKCGYMLRSQLWLP